jgi:hypothetical protein
MAPTSASGSANPPRARIFAAPVNTVTGAEVVVFRPDVVVELVTGGLELGLEDVVVGGEGEAGEVEADEVAAGGETVDKVTVAPQSERELPFGQQPASVQ